MSTHQEKLDQVNKTEGKTILDCIDRPIRPLVIELNRIGLSTRFSCCGFPYDNEEEPKSHAHFPYVVLNPILNSPEVRRAQAIAAFFNLARVLPGGWELTPYQQGQWYLSAERVIKAELEFYRREKGERGLHDYESVLIGILSLTTRLRQLPSIPGTFSIIDGNSEYAGRTGDEWQIKPKETVVIETGVPNERLEGQDREEEA
jgi:hypothetical protein